MHHHHWLVTWAQEPCVCSPSKMRRFSAWWGKAGSPWEKECCNQSLALVGSLMFAGVARSHRQKEARKWKLFLLCQSCHFNCKFNFWKRMILELHYSPGFPILLFPPTLPQQYCRQNLDTLVGSISSVFKKLLIRPIDTAPCFSNSDDDHDDSCIIE